MVPKTQTGKGVIRAINKLNGDKKRRKSRKESFATYVYRTLKQVHPDMGINSKAMSVMNALLNDVFERIAEEASRLTRYSNKSTLSRKDVNTSVRMVLPGMLGVHAMGEAYKAESRSCNSKY